MNTQRQESYRRNPKLEQLLDELNALLAPIEQTISANFSMPKYPVLFIIGLPRSGTTLMMQWLSQTGGFAYPTNLLSRFYRAPAIGARIQKLLTDPEYNFRDEILDFSREIPFQSSLGKTKGALSPNEFWYFWRRFIPNIEPVWLTEDEQQQIDQTGLAAELAAIEAVFDKPFALKALILEQNIPVLASMVNQPIFIYPKRHPLYVMQSLLEAREQYYGTWESWYSIKPPEYGMLKQLSPLEQVAGQVYFSERAMTRGFADIGDVPILEVGYREFCADPRGFLARIRDALAFYGYALPEQLPCPTSFSHTDQIRLPQSVIEQLIQAYQRFSGERLIFDETRY